MKQNQNIHDHELAISYPGDGNYVLMMKTGDAKKKEDGIYQKYVVLMTSTSPSSLIQEAHINYEKKNLFIPDIIETIMDIEIKHYLFEISNIINDFQEENPETDE